MTTAPENDVVHCSTSRFGDITVAGEKVIRFVSGMPGFERLRDFILIDHDGEGLFKWLQSVEDPAVAFLLTDPLPYRPDYRVELGRSALKGLDATEPGPDIVTLVMVTVSREDKEISLNLKAPVVFNSANMRAMQYIIENDSYPSGHVIKFD
jgi:flagellar assembly factor FliW